MANPTRENNNQERDDEDRVATLERQLTSEQAKTKRLENNLKAEQAEKRKFENLAKRNQIMYEEVILLSTCKKPRVTSNSNESKIVGEGGWEIVVRCAGANESFLCICLHFSERFPGLTKANAKQLGLLKENVAKHHKIANRAVIKRYNPLREGTRHDQPKEPKEDDPEEVKAIYARDLAQRALAAVGFFCSTVVNSRNCQAMYIRKARIGKCGWKLDSL
jgi:hypothetical protein